MIRNFLIFFVLFFSFFNLSNASFDSVLMVSKTKTIKELRENIEDLDKSKLEVNSSEDKKYEYSINVEMKSFFKKDLSIKDIVIIDNIISSYNKKVVNLKAIIADKSRNFEDVWDQINELVEARKLLYTGFIDFVSIDNYSSYLAYINEETEKFNSLLKIDSEIMMKSEIVNEKISNIEWKIIEHRSFVQVAREDVIKQKVDERIKETIEDSSFVELSLEDKIKMIDDVIYKVRKMRDNYINENENIKITAYAKSSNEQKIVICMVIIDKFEEYKKWLTWE